MTFLLFSHALCTTNSRVVPDASRADGDAFEDQQHQQQKMQFAQIEIERIQEKQAAIQQIEKDVVQLNEMFHDLSYLVQEQQVGIDNIENNITQTKEDTKTAHTELVEVRSTPRPSSSVTCLLVCLILPPSMLSRSSSACA